MFRYILVPATGTDTDASVFRAALAVARGGRAHLAFLHIAPDVQRVAIPVASAESGGGAGIAEIIEALRLEASVRREKAGSVVQAFCAEHAIPLSATPLDAALSAEFLFETGEEAHWLASHGRVADLVVLGRPWDGGKDAVDAALMETGRPVLIVPTDPPEQIGQTVVIAWKEAAEAASAVAAAIPWLAQARRVVILSVDEDMRSDAIACERLQRALVWHHPSTEVRCLPTTAEEPASTLLREAAALNADLLVMGGYGHNRMREVVYGGFTKRVLRDARLPVLMAH